MKTIKFLVSALLVSAMVVLVGCQPQNQPTPDDPNTNETPSTSEASIVGVWQGNMYSEFEYGELVSSYSISGQHWKFDNKGMCIKTRGSEEIKCEYKLIDNNTTLQLIYDGGLVENYNVKTITSTELEVVTYDFDEFLEEAYKYVYTFKRIE